MVISSDCNGETGTRDICSQNNRGRPSARALIGNRCSTSITARTHIAVWFIQKWDTYLLCRVWASAGVSVPWLNPRSSRPGAVPDLCPWLNLCFYSRSILWARARACVCRFPRADPPSAGRMLQFARRWTKCSCWQYTALFLFFGVFFVLFFLRFYDFKLKLQEP